MEDRKPIIIKENKEKLEKIRKKYNKANMSDETANKIRRLEITNKALIAATAACGVITIIDWIVPDPIPVIDEAVLTGITSLLGTASGIVNSNIKKLVNEENAELTFEDVQTLTNEINSIKSNTTSMHK